MGNTRDDGSACGFGGCLYTRPADREDDFTDVAARLGVEWDVGDGALYLTVASGYRPPQATELYRLQSGQSVAQLDSERLVSGELGYRRQGLSLVFFTARNSRFIFRDGDGFTSATAGRDRTGLSSISVSTLVRTTSRWPAPGQNIVTTSTVTWGAVSSSRRVTR